MRGLPNVASPRRIIAVLGGLFGVFLLCFGVGNQNIIVVIASLLVIALAAASRLSALLRPRQREWVFDTGRVVLVSDDPPPTGEYGRCELRLAVDAPGLPPTTVVVRDTHVPVEHWPHPGMELPIKVAADNVRNVQIQWPSPGTTPSWSDEDAFVDDQPSPVPHQHPASRLGSADTELIDFDIDDYPPPIDHEIPDAEAAPLSAPPAPSQRPSPRPRPAVEAAEVEPAAAAAATVVASPPVVDPTVVYPSAHPSPGSAIHGVGVTLLVTDLQRSTEFYRDLLGFYEVDGGDDNVVLASGDTRLVLRESTEAGRTNRRTVHLNLMVVGDIEQVYAELKDNGVRFIYPPRVVNRSTRLELWGAAFRDPDGHGIGIAEWRTPA